MDSQSIRRAFSDFFAAKGHEVVASSSLIPGNDPTLLFTNAGMVQFKEVFLGQEQRNYKRATTIQRCLRAGGKHNDLENVGYTARHHTFFEMMGNFSFGDYFKREAIAYAWEFLTEVVKLPPEKLWVTVFEEDDEAAAIWLEEIGVDPERFSRIGAKDNFWSMGDTGPCGPCTEIFYDHGPAVAGGPPGSADEDGDRYIEIWNLVFMQYNRLSDGVLEDLPNPSVDTGMGLERLAAILQGKHDNYDIDIFVHLIKAIAAIAGLSDYSHKSLRVIADHIRACAFLIADGVTPGNEGRGYVLRRIIRRAVRHGYQLGIDEAFLFRLVEPLIEVMGEAYPELIKQQALIERALNQEEAQFSRTLHQGLNILEKDIAGVSGKIISGEVVFKLYDTYGFPADLTADIARERGLSVDMAGFEVCMNQQRERARSAGRFEIDYNKLPQVEGESIFSGYERTADTGQITLLLDEAHNRCNVLKEGEQGAVVLNQSPFYAESGGQVGDCGVLQTKQAHFIVQDTRKQGGAIIHLGYVSSGVLNQGDTVYAQVDAKRREQIKANHSATHLLHAALKQVLGNHVVQKGSIVLADRLRFDFTHFEAISDDELCEIELLVNAQIRANIAVETMQTSLDKAKKMGAVALFGEKYQQDVRVLQIGQFSMELCGGTHVSATGDIGLFKITGESAIAAGIRRIEAITGEAALVHFQQLTTQQQTVAALLKSSREQLVDKLNQLLLDQRQLKKALDKLKAEQAVANSDNLADQVIDVDGVKLLAAEVCDIEPKAMRELLDQLKLQLGSAVIVLGLKRGDKVNLVAGVTDDLTARYKAGDLIRFVAQQVGGKGGGRADMAQAGGTQPENLATALACVPRWLQQ
jgi:alanyl-tRNA synthetase